METGTMNRDQMIERIVYHSCRLAGAKTINNYHEQANELDQLKTWLLRYVLQVVRESEDIQDEALRSLLSDDRSEGVADPSPDPSDALAPDPGTVACPSCDAPMGGATRYQNPGQKPEYQYYVCGRCGYRESR